MAAQNQRIKSAISLIVKPPHSHFNTDKYHINDVFTLYFIIVSGAVAEQFAGQHLLYSGESYADPELYYWNREQRSSSAEVDYLLAHGAQVVPFEIKAGKVGSLKSLHIFAAEKGITRAVRFNTDIPSRCMVSSAVASKQSDPFELISLPLYLIGETNRLLD